MRVVAPVLGPRLATMLKSSSGHILTASFLLFCSAPRPRTFLNFPSASFDELSYSTLLLSDRNPIVVVITSLLFYPGLS